MKHSEPRIILTISLSEANMTHNAPAAIIGSYCDLRFVKSRKVAQITIEIPIEAAQAFITSFGAPDPAIECSVALARLDINAQIANDEAGGPRDERRKWDELSAVQQCAMRCNEPTFERFLLETGALLDQSVEATVRKLLGVQSRSELSKNPRARELWEDLNSRYQTWMRVPL